MNLFHQRAQGQTVVLEHDRDLAMLRQRLLEVWLTRLTSRENYPPRRMAAERHAVVTDTQHDLFHETTQQRTDRFVDGTVSPRISERLAIKNMLKHFVSIIL